MKKNNIFLEMLTDKAQIHRNICNNLKYNMKYEDNDPLDDTKFQDGMATMAEIMAIQFKQLYKKELKNEDN